MTTFQRATARPAWSSDPRCARPRSASRSAPAGRAARPPSRAPRSGPDSQPDLDQALAVPRAAPSTSRQRRPVVSAGRAPAPPPARAYRRRGGDVGPPGGRAGRRPRGRAGARRRSRVRASQGAETAETDGRRRSRHRPRAVTDAGDAVDDDRRCRPGSRRAAARQLARRGRRARPSTTKTSSSPSKRVCISRSSCSCAHRVATRPPASRQFDSRTVWVVAPRPARPRRHARQADDRDARRGRACRAARRPRRTRPRRRPRSPARWSEQQQRAERAVPVALDRRHAHDRERRHERDRDRDARQDVADVAPRDRERSRQPVAAAADEVDDRRRDPRGDLRVVDGRVAAPAGRPHQRGAA